MRHLIFCVLGLAACSVSPSRCHSPNEAEGTEGRSVFAYPPGLASSWPIATGDRLSMTAISAGDAPDVTVRTSDPTVFEVVTQRPRVLRCWQASSLVAEPCDPTDSETEAKDEWILAARGEGKADLRLETADGGVHDRLPLSVTRVESLELIAAFSGSIEETPSLGSSLALPPSETPHLLSVRARDIDGRLVAVFCSTRVSVDDPQVASVTSLIEDGPCELGDSGVPAGPWFGLQGLVKGETRLRLTSGELESVVRVVIE